VRPDQDLLGDLRAEGFQEPVLFRTCAQYWVDRMGETGEGHTNGVDGHASHALPPSLTSSPSQDAPEGEEFEQLTRWLELGLNRLEIEAIKARGVSQLLRHLQETLEAACPPNLTEAAAKTREVWAKTLAEEARGSTAVLLSTLEPYQKEIEHHFALQRQQHFRGLMGTYLAWFNKMRYAGSTLRDRIPFMPRLSTPVHAPAQWDLAGFTTACSNAAADRHLDARCRALANRLLVEADQQDFPVSLLSEPTEQVAQLDWRTRHAQALVEVLSRVEHEWSRPTGPRRWLQASLVFLADWLPLTAFAAMVVILLWRYTMVEGSSFSLTDLLLPFMVTLLVMVFLHIVIALFLPLRWHAIQGEFERQLEKRLREDLEQEFAKVPAQVVDALADERKKIEKLLHEVREVAGWLAQREQAASIAGLYGADRPAVSAEP